METLMRSSDIAGADAAGFGVGQGKQAQQKPEPTTDRPQTDRLSSAKPARFAIAATALAAATLFVAHDIVRSIDDAQGDLRLIAQASQALAPSEPRSIQAVATRMTRTLDTPMVAALGSDAPGEWDMLTHTVDAGTEGGQVVFTSDMEPVVADILPRALAAYGLAFLVGAVSLRRREDDADPVAVEPVEEAQPVAPVPATRTSELATLIGAIPYGVACWNREGRLIACNPRYLSSIGAEAGETPVYHEAVKRLIRGGYMKLVTDGDRGRTLELHRDDGSCLLIDERPIGEAGFMTLVSDVTERKKADMLLTAIREEQRLLARRYHEEKLKAEAASRSKTNFLAHLSHDVRTPLNHIIGFADLIAHQTYGPVDARYLDYIRSIKSSGEHLLDSFSTILDLAEFEGGQKALSQEFVAIDEVLVAVARRFRSQATRAGVRLIQRDPCGATIVGDRLALERMVNNIVENALRFTGPGGTVTLAAFAAPDGVVLEISDTGLGMSEERLASLAQPFALGDATFTREGVGPGLGIPIARAIAELSGGHMAIDSSPALGTTVAFSLPMRSDALDQPEAAE
jgi:two-component system cell cycle sensor histidine kinase PleC